MHVRGDHLGRAKAGFTHEAIYIGALLGLSGEWVVENTPDHGVHVAAYSDFSNDQPVWRIARPANGQLVAERALALCGRAYSLVGYNCQDFCRHALYGAASSPEREQVVVVGLIAAVLGGVYAATRPSYDAVVDRHRDRRGRFARR